MLRLCVALALVVILLAIAGNFVNERNDPAGPTSTGPAAQVPSSGPREVLVLDGQGVAIETPNARTTRAVLFLHGSGQNSRSLFTDPQRRVIADALLTAGYAVAASDAGLENWGSRAGIDAHLNLAAELRRRGFADIAILAESMGGLSLPAVASGVRARAAAAWYPVCNLQSVVSAGRFNDQIARAYGGAVQTPAGLSPVSFENQPSLRLSIWASPADTVVPKIENADVCASQARAAGIQVLEISTSGEHGDPSNFQPGALVAFFNDSDR